MSRKLILKMSISVDGFVGGPNGEIDWIFASMSADATDWIVELLQGAGLHIMGRRTYHDMASYWPTSTLPFASPMNSIPKMVFTRSGALEKPDLSLTTTALKDASEAHSQTRRIAQLDEAILNMWMNPNVGGRDMVSEIGELKASDGKPIIAHGGASFAASLIEQRLVDEFRLIVHPIALGRGLSIFERLSLPLSMELIDSRKFAGGAIANVFEPIEPTKQF
jgi:dihydrofolate reductase